MHEVREQYDFSNEPWQDGTAGGVDIAIIADNGLASSEPEPVADTSYLLAPDERGEEEAPKLTTTGADIKKPPTDPPEVYHGTPEEDPEDNNDTSETQDALGRLANTNEVTIEAGASQPTDLPSGVERISLPTQDLVINRSHPDQAIVDSAIAKLEDGSPWEEFTDCLSHLNTREYLVDDPEDPKLFAKTTDYSREEHDRTTEEGVREVVQASEVRDIINSPQAQELAQQQGFTGISFVEPLLVADKHGTQQQTVVYPWQEGRAYSGEEGLHGAIGGSVPGSELHRLSTVVDRLEGLFGANGISAEDFGNEQILVGRDGMLHLIDTEGYERFDPPEPTLAPNETRYQDGYGWQDFNLSTRDEVHVVDGVTVTTRSVGAENPEIVSNTGDGCIVTVWNPFTGESGMVNIQHLTDGHQQLEELKRAVPTLVHPGVVSHIVGQSIVDPEDGNSYLEYAELAFSLGGASQIGGVRVDENTTVRLDTSNGKLETFNEQGEKTFSYTPPTAIDPT